MTVKRNKIRIAIFTTLLLCLIVGRLVIALQFEKSMEIPKQNVQTKDDAIQDEIYDVEVIGSKTTSDTPWGFTAGEFEMEDGTNCILLTPGTSMRFSINKGLSEYLNISWMLHPWVSASSDGAGAVVEIQGEQSGEPIIKKEFFIDATEDFIAEKLDISEIPETELRISITCTSGKSDNENADWLVIEKITAD